MASGGCSSLASPWTQTAEALPATGECPAVCTPALPLAGLMHPTESGLDELSSSKKENKIHTHHMQLTGKLENLVSDVECEMELLLQ